MATRCAWNRSGNHETMKTKTVTTYLPPELVPRMDAEARREGCTRSALLRKALFACLTDAEWTRVTGFRKKLALEMGRNRQEVDRRIEELRAKKTPVYPGLSRRLRKEFNLDREEPLRKANGDLVNVVPSPERPKPGKPARAVAVPLAPDVVAQMDGMIAETDISRSALLRAILKFYLSDLDWDRMLIENEKRARTLGITPEDVPRLVKEVRAEMQAEKLRAEGSG